MKAMSRQMSTAMRDVDRADMAARGKIGGYARAAKYPAEELTAAPRAGFIGRFLREVEERNPGLPDGERQRRAKALLNAYMAQLARASALARRKNGRKAVRS